MLRYSDSTEQLFLLELPSQKEAGSALQIKLDPPVLTSTDCTYSLKHALTSNSLLLVDSQNQIVANLASYIECTKIPPNTANLLQYLVSYSGPEAEAVKIKLFLLHLDSKLTEYRL